MKITTSSSFLPRLAADASLAFHRDVLGFEVQDHGERDCAFRDPAGNVIRIHPEA